MSIHEWLGIASGVLAFLTVVPYVWDIIGRITKPNAVTYFIWTLIQLVAIAAQLEAGASWSIFLIIGTTLNTGIIFLLAIAGYGYQRFTASDAIALIVGGAAIVALIYTDHPDLVIILPVVADALGAVPTVIKTKKHPETEERFSWFLMIIACGLGVAATEKLDLANILYPSFLLLEAVVIFCLAYFGKRKLTCRWGRGCS